MIKRKPGGGRKNSGRRNQCLLTWTAKEFNYTGRIFLPLLRLCGRWRTGGVVRKGARGEFHFRVPHGNDGPLRCCRRQWRAKKKGPRAFMSPASLSPRGVTRSIYSARARKEKGRKCNGGNCEFASPYSRLRFANREIGNSYR